MTETLELEKKVKDLDEQIKRIKATVATMTVKEQKKPLSENLKNLENLENVQPGAILKVSSVIWNYRKISFWKALSMINDQRKLANHLVIDGQGVFIGQ